jgi:predicted  nucleic acid-binding Zn-ribbon protein
MILPVVRQLLALQECDQKIRTFEKDLRDMPRLEEHARSRLSDDEAALTKARGAVQDIEVKIKGLQLDVGTRRTSIARLKDQQFTTRKNEEFQALSHEVTRYENEVTKLEDSELELMEQLEVAKPPVGEAQAKLKETKKHVDEELAALADRAKAVEARVAELKAQRAQFAAEVDATTLSLYDRLMKSKAGTAIAALSDGICQGCHVRVVIGTVQKLKANEGITQCEQCGRVLYEPD